jgi:hypothetical protein
MIRSGSLQSHADGKNEKDARFANGVRWFRSDRGVVDRVGVPVGVVGR